MENTFRGMEEVGKQRRAARDRRSALETKIPKGVGRRSAALEGPVGGRVGNDV